MQSILKCPSTSQSVMCFPALPHFLDPHVFLSPIVVKFKIVLRKNWVHGTEWDKTVPLNFNGEFTQYFMKLPTVGNFQYLRTFVKNSLK